MSTTTDIAAGAAVSPQFPLAFSTLACPRWSLERVVEAARRYGYLGVELRLIDGETIGPELSAGERRRVRSLFRDEGVPIVAVDTSIRLAGADPDQAGAELGAFLDIAAEWGAPLVRVFGGQPPAGEPRDAVQDAMARQLAGAAPEAERRGVAIAVETHDAFSSAREVAALLSRVESRAVGAVWDLVHTCRMGETPEQVVRILGERLLHVHVKDGRGRPGDAAWELVLLGEGDVPVADALRALHAHGYRGWLAVEWEKKWHPELAEPEVALPWHAAAMTSLAAAAGRASP
jgi:sugar phosphate isomerase/epimerase